MKIDCVIPFSSITVHLHIRMTSLQPRSYLDILYKTVYQHNTCTRVAKRTQEAEQLATEMLAQSKEFYNTHAHPLPDIQVGSKVALQNQKTKLWNIYME